MSARRARTRPFVALRAESAAPLVLTCEHAARRLPDAPDLSRGEREILASHWGWDIGAWALTRALSERIGCPAIGGRWSRLLIDLNRRVDDPTLIRTTADGCTLSWNVRLSKHELERRVLAYHSPFHEQIDRLIVRRVVRGVRPLLFAVHTFAPHYEGRRRSFDAGVLYARDRGPARAVATGLRAGGLVVRFNEPYSGMAGMMYSVDRHAAHHDLPCLELEIRHDLLEGDGAIARIADVVEPGLRTVMSRL